MFANHFAISLSPLIYHEVKCYHSPHFIDEAVQVWRRQSAQSHTSFECTAEITVTVLYKGSLISELVGLQGSYTYRQVGMALKTKKKEIPK